MSFGRVHCAARKRENSFSLCRAIDYTAQCRIDSNFDNQMKSKEFQIDRKRERENKSICV